MNRYSLTAAFLLILLLPRIGESSITVSSLTVRPGEAVLISVNGGNENKLKFGKTVLPLFNYGDGTVKCIAGLPLDVAGSIPVSCGKEKVELVVAKTASGKLEKLNIPAKEDVDEKRAAAEHEKILKSIATVTGKKLWAGKFAKPVPGVVKAAFGVGRIVNGSSGGGHRGVDLAGALGEPVKSAASGIVIYCERTIASGNSVVVDHGQGVVSVYFHMNSFGVKSGESVKKGQVLGTVGSTGFSTGPHLHWGVYVFGVCVDPFVFVRKDFFLVYRKR